MGARTGPFRRSDRLLRPREFQHVTRHGRRAAVRGFVLFAAARAAPCGGGPRLGITVSRRVGNAVVRSRVKRCIREWFRQERRQLAAGLDLVVIARETARELSADEVGRLLGEGVRDVGATRS